MLGHFPAELQGDPLVVGRSALGLDDGGVAVESGGVGGLRQVAAGDRFHHQGVGAGGHAHQAQILLGGENGERLRRVLGRGDGFDEGLGDFARGLLIHRAVDADYAAEGRYRIGLECLAVGLDQRILLGAAARIGVLDDGDGGAVELVDQLPGGVEIHQVVVGEFLALQLFGAGDPGPGARRARPTDAGSRRSAGP